MAKASGKLAQRLGDFHDLAFLGDWLNESADSPEEEKTVLLGLICVRQRELERTALDLGAELFDEKPAALERRLVRYVRDRGSACELA